MSYRDNLFINDDFENIYNELYDEAEREEECADDTKIENLLDSLDKSINYGNKKIVLDFTQNLADDEGSASSEIAFKIDNNSILTIAGVARQCNYEEIYYEDENGKSHTLREKLNDNFSCRCVVGTLCTYIVSLYEDGHYRDHNMIICVPMTTGIGNIHWVYGKFNIKKKDIKELYDICIFANCLRCLNKIIKDKIYENKKRHRVLLNDYRILYKKLGMSKRSTELVKYCIGIENTEDRKKLKSIENELIKREEELTCDFKSIIDGRRGVDYSKYDWNEQIINCGSNGWDCGYRVIWKGIVKEIANGLGVPYIQNSRLSSVNHSLKLISSNSSSNKETNQRTELIREEDLDMDLKKAKKNYLGTNDIDELLNKFIDIITEINDQYSRYKIDKIRRLVKVVKFAMKFKSLDKNTLKELCEIAGLPHYHHLRALNSKDYEEKYFSSLLMEQKQDELSTNDIKFTKRKSTNNKSSKEEYNDMNSSVKKAKKKRIPIHPINADFDGKNDKKFDDKRISILKKEIINEMEGKSKKLRKDDLIEEIRDIELTKEYVDENFIRYLCNLCGVTYEETSLKAVVSEFTDVKSSSIAENISMGNKLSNLNDSILKISKEDCVKVPRKHSHTSKRSHKKHSRGSVEITHDFS